MGYELNPYDPCVANKMINGKQCSIGFYVDDVIAAHDDDEVLTELIDTIKKKVGEITVSRGNRHTFLGMDLTFHENRTVSISMKDYLNETIEGVP